MRGWTGFSAFRDKVGDRGSGDLCMPFTSMHKRANHVRFRCSSYIATNADSNFQLYKKVITIKAVCKYVRPSGGTKGVREIDTKGVVLAIVKRTNSSLSQEAAKVRSNKFTCHKTFSRVGSNYCLYYYL